MCPGCRIASISVAPPQSENLRAPQRGIAATQKTTNHGGHGERIPRRTWRTRRRTKGLPVWSRLQPSPRAVGDALREEKNNGVSSAGRPLASRRFVFAARRPRRRLSRTVVVESSTGTPRDRTARAAALGYHQQRGRSPSLNQCHCGSSGGPKRQISPHGCSRTSTLFPAHWV